MHTWPELRARLEAFVAERRVRFVRGFFEQSLTPTLAPDEGMRPALYQNRVEAAFWVLRDTDALFLGRFP